MNKRTMLIALTGCLLIAALLTGCGGGQGGSPYGSGSGSDSGGGSATGPTIVEKGLAFDPAQLEVNVGDTVTFENQDTAAHNVRIADTELGQQAQGESKTWQAVAAGTFPYTCTIHPSMAGEITVK